jgi:N-acylglucosamine-6-phosphate 2-epimerase
MRRNELTWNQKGGGIGKLKGGLIVSCQAPAGSPLDHPQLIAAFAQVAQRQGAVGIRIDGERNIRAVREAIRLPIIGIEKQAIPGFPVYITPTLESVRRVSRAGAEIVALDCTARPRPDAHSLDEIISAAKRENKVVVMADISSLEEGLAAEEFGADIIATTLHGYTEDTHNSSAPAFELLRNLVSKARLPVVLEGRVHTPDQVRKAFELGAHAVVVGTAITNAEWLTRRFVEATPRAAQQASVSEK